MERQIAQVCKKILTDKNLKYNIVKGFVRVDDAVIGGLDRVAVIFPAYLSPIPLKNHEKIVWGADGFTAVQAKREEVGHATVLYYLTDIINTVRLSIEPNIKPGKVQKILVVDYFAYYVKWDCGQVRKFNVPDGRKPFAYIEFSELAPVLPLLKVSSFDTYVPRSASEKVDVFWGKSPNGVYILGFAYPYTAKEYKYYEEV